jgi:SAM-dependent methyltransferase
VALETAPRKRSRLGRIGYDGSRERYLAATHANQRFLLSRRVSWMNRYIDPDRDDGVEIGAGIGFTRDFVQARSVLLTDFQDHPWLDLGGVDGLATPFSDGQFDFAIANNALHHMAFPMRFFEEMRRILKPGGRLLIQEMNASLAMRAMIKILRHERYSFDPDVFDRDVACNNPDRPGSANCAIPTMLFANLDRFRRHVPYFDVVETGYSEFLVWLDSGGVNAKTPYVPLPVGVLRVLELIDRGLIRVAPGIFALQRRIALRKSPS